MNLMSKTLILIGFSLIALGVAVHFGDKFLNFGKLPGDIAIEKSNFSFYFPITSSILLSIVASFIIWVIRSFNRPH